MRGKKRVKRERMWENEVIASLIPKRTNRNLM